MVGLAAAGVRAAGRARPPAGFRDEAVAGQVAGRVARLASPTCAFVIAAMLLSP